MDTIQVTARNIKIARLSSTVAENYGIVLFQQLGSRNITSCIGIGKKADTFCLHQMNATIHVSFAKLEIGYSISEQSAQTVVSFKYRDQMTGFI